MKQPHHALERRANLLAASIKDRTNALAYGITPKGSNPPFTKRFTPREALAWWMKHRWDDLGMALVAKMAPLQVAQLDAWINQAGTATPAAAPGADPGMIPGVQGVLTRALGAERRMEGPPIGNQVA